MKNTFKVLRAKLRDTQNKLNGANRIVALQLQKLERLRSVIRMQDNQIIVLNNQLETEANRTSSLSNRIITVKRSRDIFYKKWMQDHSKIKFWKSIAYGGILFGITITVLNIIDRIY